MVEIDMAILIPSKNIYEKQNPKVRDNVIERIEVGAVEVLNTKDNNANVYNNTFVIKNKSIENNANNFYWEAPTTIYNGFVVSTLAYVEYNNHTYTNIEIKIPLLQQNAWIKELNLGKDKDNNPNIQYNIGGYVNKGTVSSSNWSGTIQKSGSKAFISSLTKQSLSYNQTETGDYQTYQIPKESTSSFVKYDVASGSANAKVSVVDGGNLITVKPETIIENGIEYYKLSLKVLVGCRIVKITSYNSVPESYSTFDFPISKENFNIGEATYEEYIPEEINLTVYGQTIGIDLTDKTVYINGQIAKKVHSVDGNELMQTSNYYQSTDTNAITKAFSDTLTDYAKGKETAIIRCSIGDYYDYNSGDKVISVDNSTGKMSFKLYDKVIPMVYGADRKDRPMSTYQDGSPKVFQVFGSKIYYDGAVWQELSLQEVDKTQIN